ncbi:hypothetical protein GCM10017788_03670 [Amycolatopsis acidiphila]|nr:hypothetical protein GCM10017788_03670 [Amycolatopsis acidiphila]
MVTPVPMAAEAGAGIELGGICALLLPPLEALSLLPPPHAASDRAATAANPAPAIRTVFTKTTPFQIFLLSSGIRCRPRGGLAHFAVNVTVGRPVAPSGTVPARSPVCV